MAEPIAWRLLYHPRVISHDIPLLSSSARERVRLLIEQKLVSDPLYFGIPLRGTLRPYRKMRVGDYRVVFLLEGTDVLILAIGHRNSIYSKTQNRT
jgi:mRNA interferase RelE/StbE